MENSRALQVFDFEETPIRTVEMDGELMWVAADICRALDINNPSDAVNRLEPEYLVSNEVLDSRGVSHKTNLVNEAGLYTLILGSRKPEAKRFSKWVTSEVLPSIRKTGKYQINPAPKTLKLKEMQSEYNAAIKLAKLIGLTGNQAIIAGNRVMQNRYGEDCLKIIGEPDLVCDVQDVHLTATDIGAKLGVSCQVVNKVAISKGLVRTNRDAKGKLSYLPTDSGSQYCFLKDVLIEGRKTSKQHLAYYQSAIEFFKQNIN